MYNVVSKLDSRLYNYGYYVLPYFIKTIFFKCFLKPLVYVIGSEVPIPGGSQDAEKGIQITKVHDFIETVEVFEKTFKKYSLDKVWQDVIAIVVQPGVEFGDNIVHGYNREAAK
ncbi:unnamed protein product, partial [marine sediment metagenome]